MLLWLQGPSATLKIKEYSLARDVQDALARPRCPPSAFQTPPLVVLSGFGNEQHLKLTGVLFQNMFPPINVNQTKASQCQVHLQNAPCFACILRTGIVLRWPCTSRLEARVESCVQLDSLVWDARTCTSRQYGLYVILLCSVWFSCPTRRTQTQYHCGTTPSR